MPEVKHDRKKHSFLIELPENEGLQCILTIISTQTFPSCFSQIQKEGTEGVGFRSYRSAPKSARKRARIVTRTCRFLVINCSSGR